MDRWNQTPAFHDGGVVYPFEKVTYCRVCPTGRMAFWYPPRKEKWKSLLVSLAPVAVLMTWFGYLLLFVVALAYALVVDEYTHRRRRVLRCDRCGAWD